MLAVRGGRCLVGRQLVEADVLIDGGRITAIGPDVAAPGGAAVVKADGCIVAPGFVDLQCNGTGGIDLTTSPERVGEVAALLARSGVTAWLPTVVTAPAEVRRRGVEAITAASSGDVGAASLGVHLEGPFLSVEHRGAHRRDWLASPADEGWSRAGGVALVTLAPELPGALDVIRALTGRGVVVSAGHTGATAAELATAVDAGVTMVTHLYNGMAGFHHRSTGPIGAALTDDRLAVGLIADGVHADPVAVDLAWRAAGSRVALVTDAVGGPLRLADGTLAGSSLTMDAAVRNLIAFTGCPVEDALRAASSVPAAVLGLDDRGTLAPGAVADLVVLDDRLGVVTTIVAGVPVAVAGRAGAGE